MEEKTLYMVLLISVMRDSMQRPECNNISPLFRISVSALCNFDIVIISTQGVSAHLLKNCEIIVMEEIQPIPYGKEITTSKG